jgi:hypothetical protein
MEVSKCGQHCRFMTFKGETENKIEIRHLGMAKGEQDEDHVD